MASLAGSSLGPYQVLEQIGRGGMAAVYRAHEPRRDRFVALKVLAPHLCSDPSFEERFRREAQVLTRLAHPSIVPVEAFGEVDGHAYLVMPYLPVGTLSDRLRDAPIGPQEGARLVRQISEALQYAHDDGVVHRDVKPSNVLLDEEGNALLSDFGLARMQEASASLTGSALVGTPAYMSPEQARGEKADPLSDQYSLGVILYLLTTGHLPFEAETPMAVALKQIHEPLPLIRENSPNVPEAVERVILKATAKAPGDRFASVADLNDAFQAAVAHALDPLSNPAPRIELPSSVRPTISLPASRGAAIRGRLGVPRPARLAGLLLALILAYPVLASGLKTFLGPGSQSVEQQASYAAGAEGEQLAALAGTIAVMSTELAASQGFGLGSAELQTAVVQTLVASGVIPEDTPAPPPSGTAGSGEIGAAGSVNYLTPISLSTAVPTPGPTTAPTVAASQIPPTPTASTLPNPTSTPTQLPSSTPLPTSTPVPAGLACSDLSLGDFTPNAKDVRWEVVNGTAVSVTITAIHLDWPASHVELKKIKLGGSLIWKEGDDSPPSDIQSGWQSNRSLSAGQAKVLAFEFESAADGGGYALLLEFDNTCQLTAGG